jgi:hypothetical protein
MEVQKARRQRLGEDTIQDVVERIGRYGDRSRSAGDTLGEREARDAVLRAQSVSTVDEALGIEQALLQIDGEDPTVVGQQVVKKKKGWFRRWFGGGDDDDVDTDNS